jgi:hypothetical protein
MSAKSKNSFACSFTVVPSVAGSHLLWFIVSKCSTDTKQCGCNGRRSAVQTVERPFDREIHHNFATLEFNVGLDGFSVVLDGLIYLPGVSQSLHTLPLLLRDDRVTS